MHVVYTLDGLHVLGVGDESIRHMDPPNHQHAVFLLDLSHDFTDEATLVGPDLARLQRATEGPD